VNSQARRRAHQPQDAAQEGAAARGFREALKMKVQDCPEAEPGVLTTMSGVPTL